MDVGRMVAGVVLVLVGVLLVLKRRAVADLAADAVRQSSSSSSLLNRERTDRDLVQPYTSRSGRQLSSQMAAAWGVLLAGAGLYLVILGF